MPLVNQMKSTTYFIKFIFKLDKMIDIAYDTSKPV